MNDPDALMRVLLGRPRTVEALVAELGRPLGEVEALVDAAFVDGMVILLAKGKGTAAPADRLVRVSKRAFVMYDDRPPVSA